jgi:GT2 family glycosyltransferase
MPLADARKASSLVRSADLVLARSSTSAATLDSWHTNVLRVFEGCAPESSLPPRRMVGPLNRPLIGYAGDGPLDIGLLGAVAELRPDWTFVLLTHPTAGALGQLDTLANVHVLDSVAPEDRPAYMADVDVALVPLVTTMAALDRFPVEVPEALAAGKPVVGTPHPDLVGLQAAGVSLAAGPLELAAAIDRALSSAHDAAAGRAAALEARWDVRVDRLVSELDSLVPSLDIVITSYDNPVALERCLHSLLRDRSCPSRVFVVDNASGPQTQLVLDAAEAGGAVVERLAVNAGWPAAVNRGLELGQGRYVLILNDDVQLPAGAKLAFVHGLARSRRIGLAGPVTNAVTNEARIEVPYTDRHPPHHVVDAIHEQRVRQHRGETFDLRVAALFAAVARRADLEAVGGLSERYQLGQFDDDDLCHRLRDQLGLRVVCCDDIYVHHAGMSAFGALDEHLLEGLFSRNRRVFERLTGVPWQPHRTRAPETH